MLAKRFVNLFRLVIAFSLAFHSRSDPLDITAFSGTPIVGEISKSWFRGYTLDGDKDIRDLSVGILYKNGKDNVTWADTGNFDGPSSRDQDKNMPDGKIFPTESLVIYRIRSGDKFSYLGVSELQAADRIGVFTFEAKKNGEVTNSAIVLTSSSANVEMEYRTITVGVGESVTINLSKGGDLPDLRWRHNYNNELENLMGFNSAVIKNIRRKDDGVYECYTGDSPDGNRGNMRLIVRACPSPKWNPPDCEMDCPVCYNGGVCDDKTGVCICPAGFKGTSCKQGCGNNNWGRDCKVVCSSSGNCQGALLCPPDPVGCACQNGFGGNDCNTECVAGYYGADCRQECHCNDSVCDKHTGCSTGCLDGYAGDNCQVPLSCSSGFFGFLCNFRCHCKDSVDCNRNGSCPNGCHEAWAGSKCSIALPYRSEPPRVVNQTATTLTFDVIWIIGDDYGTGTITKRKLSYKSSGMDSIMSIDEEDNDLFISIGNLIPNTKYQFYSHFSRMVGGIETEGPRSTLGSINTICTKPLEEPEIKLATIVGNQVTVNLKGVSDDYDRIQCKYILRYQVQYSDIDGNESKITNTSSIQLEVKLSRLSWCSSYNVNARVVNNMDIAGNWGQAIMVQSSPSEPSIEDDSFNGTHLLMKWIASTCDISNYQVTYYYELSGGIIQQGNTTETEVVFGEGIESCIEYTFSVLASYLNVNGTSDTTTIIVGSNCPDQGTEASIGVILGCLIPALVVVLIVVLIVIKRRRSNKSSGVPGAGAFGTGVSPAGGSARKILQEQDIGDNAYDEVSGVDNSSKEQVHTEYEVESESEYQPDNEIDQEPVYGNTQLDNQEYKPIELSKLHDYVTKRQLSVEKGFEKEFEDLGNKPLFPSTVAKSSVNRKKNRYANVIPYDNTRVVLDKIADVPGSDYINASYLDGYTIPHEFIACQGPNVASVNDMWRMVWKEKSRVIVVVTNLVEGKRKKCEQYWPDLNSRKVYTDISVTNADETNYGHYVTRTFQVQKVGDGENIHNVYQYHFTEWPDKSVSNAVPQLIDFIQTFRKTQQEFASSGPVIVHCSAGAGRTGTVIAIAAMLDMSKDQGKVDVFNFVRSMRQNRIQMVQTEEQYKFIYAVILEELFCGKTVIPVTELQNEIQRQTQKMPSHFDYQLKTLNCLFPLPVDDLTSHARLPENVFKNRFDDVVPLNKARPILMSPSDRGTDYINASFCDVYKKRNAYIVTQAPLADPANTTEDFWRLVFDYKSDVIVQLNDIDRTCGAYIHKQIKQPMKFGQFIVTVKSAMKNEFMIERKISLEKENNVREIAYFEFRQWPKGKTVPKVDPFVRFITNIGEGVVSSNKPTIVHCLDGVCRSGLFCLVHSMIGKMRDDKMVDVFQTLKTLRSTCPTMLKTKVQYNFCYDAAKCYLQNYQEYVNV
ncbi:uncharacterized protein [Antedon mediterranea]|uniref:uncharacterized protein n=1 Tax=Antedon mediterranea TaxID=105859 RepID=UPI003AF60297